MHFAEILTLRLRNSPLEEKTRIVVYIPSDCFIYVYQFYEPETVLVMKSFFSVFRVPHQCEKNNMPVVGLPPSFDRDAWCVSVPSVCTRLPSSADGMDWGVSCQRVALLGHLL